MKMSLIALAAGFMALSASAASAIPNTTEMRTGATSGTAVEQVNHRRWHKKKHHHHRWHNHNDRRYYRYRGWHRYHSRPYRWRARGCIAIGPVWFCP